MEDFDSDEESEEIGDLRSDERIPHLSEFMHILLLWSVLNNIGDNAMTSLLKSLKSLFAKMEAAVSSEIFSQFSAAFPTSLANGYKFLKQKEELQPKLFTVCDKCYSVYDTDSRNPQLNQCIHQEAPAHSQASRRGICGNSLFFEGSLS